MYTYIISWARGGKTSAQVMFGLQAYRNNVSHGLRAHGKGTGFRVESQDRSLLLAIRGEEPWFMEQAQLVTSIGSGF